MKIKDIGTLCKSRKVIYIATERDEQQYIGDGAALYKINGLPLLNGEEVKTLFDIKAKDREKVTVIDYDGQPLDMNDYSDGEVRADAAYFTFCYGEKVLLPLGTAEEIILIEYKYLKPVSDEQEYQNFWKRTDNNGNSYIVVKNGMLAQAAILPFVIKDKAFINKLYELANGLDEAFARAQNAKAKETERETEEANLLRGETNV
ncbi:MAG: hypothetical protein IJC39_02820 [Firmicutes bacterium]|nr:hypothetical protein [Bacillota bacterium]